MSKAPKEAMGNALRRIITAVPGLRQRHIEEAKHIKISTNLSGKNMPHIQTIADILHAAAERSGEPQYITIRVMPDGQIRISTHHEKII